MSMKQTSFNLNSVIPQLHRTKAEPFTKCLQGKLISLGEMTGLTVTDCDGNQNSATGNYDAEHENDYLNRTTVNGRRTDSNEYSLNPNRLNEELSSLDDMVNYDVPYRVLRESSSTSNLEKHFTNNLYSTKRYSKSGNILSERLTDGARLEDDIGWNTDNDSNLLNQKPDRKEYVPAVQVSTLGELKSGPEVKLRRWSSLKTCKTPPGTPGEKKIVRFADALGLDLADVRTFLDETPRIPNSAYEDLHFTENFASLLPVRILIPQFAQPVEQNDFFERVKKGYICLENAALTDTAVLTVSGYIRVLNISYEKLVYVRYTKDDWLSFSDLQATYVHNSCDGFSDKFSFVLYGHTLKIGDRLEFAIRLECCGAQYWDNNGGKNYVFECLSRSNNTDHITDMSEFCLNDSWSTFY